MNEKNVIAWFLFLNPPPISHLCKIFSKMVAWHITWLFNTIFILNVKDDEFFTCGKFFFLKTVSKGCPTTTIIEEGTPCSDLLSIVLLINLQDVRFKILINRKLNFGRVRRCVFYTSIYKALYIFICSCIVFVSYFLHPFLSWSSKK